MYMRACRQVRRATEYGKERSLAVGGEVRGFNAQRAIFIFIFFSFRQCKGQRQHHKIKELRDGRNISTSSPRRSGGACILPNAARNAEEPMARVSSRKESTTFAFFLMDDKSTCLSCQRSFARRVGELGLFF